MPQTLISSDKESIKDSKEEEDKLLYKGAFDDFDWNKNGTIPTRVKLVQLSRNFDENLASLGSSIRHEKSRTKPHRCRGPGPYKQN